ncbi:MAG: hypothetical protein AAFQ89_16595 [Cyanobacteria bacterium J06626_18]
MDSANVTSHVVDLKTDWFLSTITWTAKYLGLAVPPLVKIDYLRSLPLGTFGRAWADHLDTHDLEPFNEGLRRQQLHDGIHVLTGYGTDPLGEAEVQAFLLGTKFHFANVLVMMGLLGAINRQRQWQQVSVSRAEVRSRLKAACDRGQRAQFDPDSWQPERHWHEPLAVVQQQFGL